MNDPPALTPTDVILLRASILHRTPGGATNLGAPYIIYLPADACWALCADGRPQCRSADVTLLAKLQVCERAERGFISRIMSADTPCDVATLNPDQRAAWDRARRVERLEAAQRSQETTAATLRRAAALDASRISLDDI